MHGIVVGDEFMQVMEDLATAVVVPALEGGLVYIESI